MHSIHLVDINKLRVLIDASITFRSIGNESLQTFRRNIEDRVKKIEQAVYIFEKKVSDQNEVVNYLRSELSECLSDVIYDPETGDYYQRRSCYGIESQLSDASRKLAILENRLDIVRDLFSKAKSHNDGFQYEAKDFEKVLHKLDDGVVYLKKFEGYCVEYINLIPLYNYNFQNSSSHKTAIDKIDTEVTQTPRLKSNASLGSPTLSNLRKEQISANGTLYEVFTSEGLNESRMIDVSSNAGGISIQINKSGLATIEQFNPHSADSKNLFHIVKQKAKDIGAKEIRIWSDTDKIDGYKSLGFKNLDTNNMVNRELVLKI